MAWAVCEPPCAGNSSTSNGTLGYTTLSLQSDNLPVGRRYERQEYFISALIMAGEIFREVMEIVQPHIRTNHKGQAQGIILLDVTFDT